MAAEWTFQVSYDPGLLAVSIGLGKATHENIAASGSFGVNIAANHQNVLCSIAGNYSGKEINKVAVLRELGFSFTKAKNIDVFMVDGATLHVECDLFAQHEVGDHTLFVGKALSVLVDQERQPLLYHCGRYWNVGTELPKPSKEERERLETIVKKFPKHRNV